MFIVGKPFQSSSLMGAYSAGALITNFYPENSSAFLSNETEKYKSCILIHVVLSHGSNDNFLLQSSSFVTT